MRPGLAQAISSSPSLVVRQTAGNASRACYSRTSSTSAVANLLPTIALVGSWQTTTRCTRSQSRDVAALKNGRLCNTAAKRVATSSPVVQPSDVNLWRAGCVVAREHGSAPVAGIFWLCGRRNRGVITPALVPKLRIPESSAQAIHAAATLYEHELAELLATRKNSAGVDYADQLVVRRMEDELDAIQVALRVRAHLEEDHIARLIGIEVRDATAAAIHSALLLQKAAFVRELAMLPRGARAQQGKASVIGAAVALIDKDVSRVWAKYGPSEFLRDVLLSWRLQNSPDHLHPLIIWIEKNGGAQSRVWFATDTNFFLESRATFEQVDWHRVWGVDRLCAGGTSGNDSRA